MTTCTKPDRDVPKLVCGYPMPCPHHTVVVDASDVLHEIVDEDRLVRALANLRWLTGRVHISTYFLVAPLAPAEEGEMRVVGASVVRIVTKCVWTKDRSGVGSAPVHQSKEYVAELPLYATITEIRNAAEEQHIEARAWLEVHYATPSKPVANTDVEVAALRALLEAQKDGVAAISNGYIPGCRRPAHRDGVACDGGCSEICDPVEYRAAMENPLSEMEGRTGGRPRPRAPRRKR